MQRVRIGACKIGLKYRKGRYVGVLNEGFYWTFSNEEIVSYDQTKVYKAPDNISVLLQDADFASATKLITIADNERGILMGDGLFMQVLQPGKYILFNEVVDFELIILDLDIVYINENVSKAILNKPELGYYIRTFTVEPYEEGVLYINGVFEKVLSSGVYQFIKNDTPILVQKVDMRLQVIDVSGQEILTRDKAALRINFFAQYKTTDVKKALTENKDMTAQLYSILQLAIREYVGGYRLDELLEKKNEISSLILDVIKTKANKLGVEIVDCGIKDVILPGDVKNIMNQVLIAEKKAQANTITRREETASTRTLLNTAKLMEENAMLFRLKEMEYVEKIAEKINGISVSGTGDLIGQLSKIFVPAKTGAD